MVPVEGVHGSRAHDSDERKTRRDHTTLFSCFESIAIDVFDLDGQHVTESRKLLNHVGVAERTLQCAVCDLSSGQLFASCTKIICC